MSESTVLTRWTGRLVARKRDRIAAQAAHKLAASRLTRARRTNAHPRQQLVDALANANTNLDRARRREAEARRVISRHRDSSHVSAPVEPILNASWGWHPPGHDGIDVMSNFKDDAVAICDGVIARVSPSGWWGKGARPTAGHPVSDGDGIIVLRCTVTSGPFRPGLLIGYGHTEGAVVKVGQVVKAGQKIGTIGWANGGHIHLMVKGPDLTPAFIEGVGDRDPKPYLDWAVAHTGR